MSDSPTDSPAENPTEPYGTEELRSAEFGSPATSPATTPQRRPGVRVSTIIWGVILLIVAAFFVAGQFVSFEGVGVFVALSWATLGLGVVLAIGGIIAAISRRGR